jgi:hypothetical protein
MERLSIKVFTSSGRRAGYWEGTDVPAGRRAYVLDLNLADGMYHYLVEAEDSEGSIRRKAGSFFVLQ